ncbi:hypothetical protein NTE19_003381 [Vibrio fluvialis]|nr:hypothetical protein [Vibrio fluvialis]
MNRQDKIMDKAISLIQMEKLPVDAMEQFDALELGADEATLACLADLRTTLYQEMMEQGLLDDESPLSQAKAVESAVAKAATSPDNDLPEPTEAQKIAGNYKKAKVSIHGLSITVENPKDSTRSGVGSDGEKWSSTMTCHYGDIDGTKGADGDKLDVFIGPDILNTQVFVVDQVDPVTGEFDEHKVMICCDGLEHARSLYLSNYEENWTGLGAITEMTLDDFKQWLKGDVSQPLGDIS